VSVHTVEDMTRSIHTDKQGHALQGHDPVAYFTVGKPTIGEPDLSLEWEGATWLFSTEEHREMFSVEPARYAPAFGGHCAVASAMGQSLPGSAKRWRVHEGRLYINKNIVAAAIYPLVAGRVHKLAEAAR
jgi:YHS domain-containing protein